MSENIPVYSIQDNPLDLAILDAFLEADDAVGRLDERTRGCALRAPWNERLLYRNACAAMLAQNCLVHLEDLVLFDGHAFSGTMYPDLSAALGILKLWQKALQGNVAILLKSPMPGEEPRSLALDMTGGDAAAQDRPEFFYDPAWDGAGRLEQWRAVWRSTNDHPPLLAAAIAWDAWNALSPEQQGPWRATLLAALVLRARGKTKHLLLPLDSGQKLVRKRWSAVDSQQARLRCFFDIAVAAGKIASTELSGLESAKERMRLRLKTVRKNSHLADLIDLMIAKPVVSIPLACKALGISKQAVRALIPKLGSTPREISERRSYRYWTVP